MKKATVKATDYGRWSDRGQIHEVEPGDKVKVSLTVAREMESANMGKIEQVHYPEKEDMGQENKAMGSTNENKEKEPDQGESGPAATGEGEQGEGLVLPQTGFEMPADKDLETWLTRDLKQPDLVRVANEDYGLGLDEKTKKKDLVEAIVSAHNETPDAE